MDEPLAPLFLDFSRKKLTLCVDRIRACAAQLTPEQIWMRHHETENAVGNLILHLTGNVRQWIIAGLGGQPDVRERDREFAARGDLSPDELIERLSSTVAEAVAVLETMTPEALAGTVVIQKHTISKLEAVYHVVEHFAGHTGQIIFITKLFTGADLGFYNYLSGPVTQQTP